VTIVVTVPKCGDFSAKTQQQLNNPAKAFIMKPYKKRTNPTYLAILKTSAPKGFAHGCANFQDAQARTPDPNEDKKAFIK